MIVTAVLEYLNLTTVLLSRLSWGRGTIGHGSLKFFLYVQLPKLQSVKCLK